MFKLSNAPFCDLYYLASEGKGMLTDVGACRTDLIHNADNPASIKTAVFSDWLSAYSPLSAKALDDYCVCPDSVVGKFLGK